MNTNPSLSCKHTLDSCQPVFSAGRIIFKARTLMAGALAGLVAALAPLSAAAGGITWGSANTISVTNDVYTNGTALYAYAGTATTVNGVTFTAVSSGTTWGNVSLAGLGAYAGNTFGFAGSPFSTLPNSYSNVLSGGAYGGATGVGVTLNGLTVGHDYAVQIWVNDSRPAGSGRSETITGTSVSLDYNSTDVGGGVGQYSVGTFAANNTNQSFSLTPSTGGSVQLNAINVRDVGSSTKTWLGATDTSWGTAANWNPANPPINPGDAVLFNASSTAHPATMLDTSYSLTTLTVSNAPSAVSIGNDGNTLTINGGINVLGNSSQSLTINDPLVLGASQTWNVTNNGTLTVAVGGVSGTAALTITGNGTVSLQAPATYTGNTTISGGKLAVASSGYIPATTISVATNGTLALSGSGYINGTPGIVLAGGSILDVSAASSTFLLNGGGLTNTSAGAVINGTNDCSAGAISMLSYDGVNPPFVQTNGTMTLSAGTVINVNNTGAILAAGNYTIIAAATTGNHGSVTGTLPAVNLTGNGAVGPVSLQTDGNGDLQMVVGSGDIWTGASDNLWSTAGNWLGGAGGGPYANPTEPVVFNNLSINNLNTVVDQSIVINQLTVVNPPAPVTIGGGNTLEIGGSGGINMQSATKDLTIAAPLNIAGNENWNIATNRSLNINGTVTGGGGPIIVGPGTVNLNSASTLGAPISVSSASTLNLGAANVLSATGDMAVNGLMNLQGYSSQTMGGLSGSGIVNNNSANPVNLTIGANNDGGNFSGTIQSSGGGALALQVVGGTAQFGSTNNSFTGGITFSNTGSTLGTLGTSASSSLGSGPVSFVGGNSYTANNSTFTNALHLDSCYLRVGGANLFVQNWTGPVTVTNGFEMSGDAGAGGVTLSGPMNIGTGGISITNYINNGGNEGYGVSTTGDLLSGAISGSGGITYYCNGGSSRITVQGANTYSGGTIVNGTGNGKLNVWGGSNPFSTGPVTLNAGAIIEAAPGSGTVTNALTLNGGTLQSESQYNNYNTLTWTGPITMTADSALVQYAVAPLNNNQSSGVNVNGPINIGGFTLTCSSPTAVYGGNTINGQISGGGNIQVMVNTLQLNGSNTFTGTFRAVSGTLGVGNVYALQNATLDMNAADAGAVSISANAVIGELIGSRNLSFGTALSIGNKGTSTTYDGVLGGGGSLVKIGSGTLTLTALNTNTGNTTVSGGTLSFSQPNFAIASTVTVAGGAFLNLNADTTNTVAGLVLNGVSQPNGIYKSGNSGGQITGIGALLVVNPNFVWTGNSSTSWNTAGNWLGLTIPSITNNVVFNNSSMLNLATVLNADFNILSLVMLNPSGPVSIGGANTLTLTNGINMGNATQPLTITAPVVVGAAQTWTNSASSVLTVSNLSGSSALTLAGGTVVLKGTNTTTGNNILLAGTTVKFAGPGSSSFPTNGTVYILNNAGANGVGTIDLNGGTQTSTAYLSFAYSTTLTLTNGTLIDNAAPTGLPDSHEDYNFMGTVNLATNGNYISNRRFIVGLNSSWANGFSFTINGTGTNGSLTWGGDNNGSMNYVGVTAGDNPTLNINGGTVNFNNATFGTGNGYLNVGANTATSKGTINLKGGNLNVGTWMKLGGNYNATTGQSGTAILTVTNGAVAIGSGSDAINNGVLFMDGGNGDATANTGTSTLTLNNAGTLTVAQIQAGNNGTKTINLNGGTIAARAGATNNFLSAATALTVNIQNGGATINSGTNSIAIAAALVANGTGGLTKTGSGALTLTGASTYTGTTTISAGTLLVNNTSGSGTGTNAVNINSGGTLGGTGTIAGVVNNNANGTLSPGTNGVGKLTVSGNLTLASGSTNTFAVNGSTSTNTSVVLGAGVTYGGVLNIVTNGTFTVGQTFTLFSGAGATSASSFASILGSPGAGKAFSFANGVLSVVSSGGVTPAVIKSVTLSGSNLIVQGTNGVAGSGYTILTSTNIALPLSSWTTNTTGTFSAGGGFSNAIPVSTSGQGFFDIRQP